MEMSFIASEGQSWTETYRPHRLAEIAGNSSAIKQLKDWADTWQKGKPKKKGAILVGSPGIGKTSAALALAMDYGWDVIELNASDQRNATAINKIVGHGSRADSFSSDGTYRSVNAGKLKLIVFDEADNLFGREDYGGAKAIVQALKETAQPIILIVNDYYELTRKASGIKQLAVTVRFSTPAFQQITDVLSRIAERESLEVSQEMLHNIAQNSGGDFRAAVNDLQSLSSLKHEDAEQVSESLGWRDIQPETYEALTEIFTSNDPKKARMSLMSLDETPDRIMMWIDDNLPRVIRDPSDRLNAIDALSHADIFLGWTTRRQYYGLWSYSSDMMSMGVCVSAGDRYQVYSDTLRFPEYLMLLSRTKAKRAAIGSLLEKTALAFHTSGQVSRDAIVPYLRGLFRQDHELAVQLTKEMELQAGDVALLQGVESDSDEVEKILAEASAEESENEKEPEEHPPEIQLADESQKQRSLFEFR